MLYSFARAVLYIYFTLFYRVKIKGAENIPATGPLLLYANHPSAMDMFIIAVYMKRKIHYMAKVELFKNPILAFLLNKIGAFPVSRGKGDVGSVRTVYKLLEQGEVVGVFPEGTRTPKKDPAKRKAGAAMLALHSNSPILPVGVNKIKKTRWELVFGETFVIPLKQEGEHASKEELKEITQNIMDKIYSLIGQ